MKKNQQKKPVTTKKTNKTGLPRLDAVRDASEKRPKHTSQYDEGASERSNEEMLRPRKSYKAILFDLDGVLVNMPDGHYEALNRALALFGVKIEREEHMRMFNGLPTRKKIEELEKAGRLPTGLKEFINAVKQKHTKEIIPKYCPPDYSKIILLQHLKNRGLKLACCTNSIRETTHLMLKSAHLFDFFDLIIGNDEVKNPKPHPETYLYTFEKLGVEPHECLIIEDAPPGIASARASGAFVIEVRGPEDVNLALFEKILNF